jgi:hypothetical protein
MVPKLTALLRKALHQLELEKQRIDHQITTLRAALRALGGSDTSARSQRRQPRMGAAARRAIGKRMKAYWAKRRAGRKK